MDAVSAWRRLTIAGLLPWLGFGGCFAGITLRQIPRWRHQLERTGDHLASPTRQDVVVWRLAIE